MNRYIDALSELPTSSWDAYLVENSGLPGPRANLELVDAFAAVASRDAVLERAASADEYLRFCGTEALGAILATDPAASDIVALLKERAADQLWRVREGAARALQLVGDARPDALCSLAEEWQDDASPYVRRAVLAALAEPRLLADDEVWRRALEACRTATALIVDSPLDARKEPAMRTLRQALGYCWSVVVAASPERGLPEFQRLRASPDVDVQWIVRSNLTKARLRRLLPD